MIRTTKGALLDREKGFKASLKNLINSHTFSDLTFLVQGRPVFAHRCILAARSSYFSALLLGDYADSQGTIEVKDISYDTFVDVVLTYMYCNEFHECENRELLCVLRVADLWNLTELAALTASQLVHEGTFDGDSCLAALNFAYQRCTFQTHTENLDKKTPALWASLYNACWAYLSSHLTDILNADANVIMHIESYDLMYSVLAAVDFASLPSATVANLGSIVMRWQSNGRVDTDTEFLHSYALEILEHMQHSVLDGKTRDRILVKVPMDDSSEHCGCHCAVGTFSYEPRVYRPAHENLFIGAALAVDRGLCELRNKWPARLTRAFTILNPETGKQHKLTSFSSSFNKRNWGRPLGRSTLVSLNEARKYMVANSVTLLIEVTSDPHPLLQLCKYYVGRCFRDSIYKNPSFRRIEASLLLDMLRWDHLDVCSEVKVLQAVVEWSAIREQVPDSVLDCIKFEYIPVGDLVHAYRNAPALRKSGQIIDHVASMLHKPPSKPRLAYTSKEVALTSKELLSWCLTERHADTEACDEIDEQRALTVDGECGECGECVMDRACNCLMRDFTSTASMLGLSKSCVDRTMSCGQHAGCLQHEVLWEVVGGGDYGGIVVRAGKALDSPRFDDFLAKDSIVRAMEVIDGHVHYRLLVGLGPQKGWVSQFDAEKRLWLLRPFWKTRVALASGEVLSRHDAKIVLMACYSECIKKLNVCALAPSHEEGSFC